jgi:O-antigen ligase
VSAAALAAYLFVVDGGPQARLPALGPNALGSTLLIALILGIGLLLLPAKTSLRTAAGAAGVLVILLMLVRTLSRGAWIGAGFGLAALLLFSWRRLTQPSPRHRHTWVVVLAVVSVLAGSISLLGGEPAVLQKKVLSIINPWRNRERLFIARSALAIAADHPLVGSGLNTFFLIHPHPSLRADALASKPKTRVQSFAHNIFLNMAAEVGLLGLAAFVAVLIRGAAAGWRWYAAAAGIDRTVSATVLAAFFGLLIHQQFDGTVSSVHISAGLWFLLAIMMANEPSPGSGVRGPGSGRTP